MKTLVIVNPKAGRRVFLNLYLPQVLRVLRRGGISYRVLQTRYEGHATRMVERLRHKVDSITVFGGDGTVREVVKGLGEQPLPIGIIPFGTVNVLALDLGIPFNPVQAAAVVVDGKKRRIDIGYLNGEPFLLMVSTGLDALTVHNVDLRTKRVVGRIAYLLSAVVTVATYRARRVRIHIPGSGVHDRGYLAIVANSRFYAGPWRIADQTRIDDGLLDVVLYKRRSVAAMLRLLAGILFNRTRFLRDVAYYRCTEVTLSSRRRQKMQMDGDKAPSTPARVWVRKKQLAVLVPRQRRLYSPMILTRTRLRRLPSNSP
jgi:YegS/Rv2252/BmrU family lipid kinase